MSEGELKKRIRKTGESYHAEDGFWDTDINPDFYNANTVESVLDEAKKEFPKIQLDHFPPTYNAPSDTYLEYVDKYDVVKWFKKWFGSP